MPLGNAFSLSLFLFFVFSWVHICIYVGLVGQFLLLCLLAERCLSRESYIKNMGWEFWIGALYMTHVETEKGTYFVKRFIKFIV